MSGGVLAVVDSESQLAPARRVAEALAQQLGSELEVNMLPGPRAPSTRQLAAALGNLPVAQLPLEVLPAASLLRFDVIVAYLTGSKLRHLNARLRDAVASEQPARRPLLVTGYNGVIYEKHTEGLLWRVGSDVIAVNSRRDMRIFEAALSDLGMPCDSLVRAGLPQFGETRSQTPPARIEGLMFACQAAVPSSRLERAYLLAKLRDYALHHPQRAVVIKPRTLPSEATFRRETHHFEPLFDLLFTDRPPNLRFEYGAFRAALRCVDQVVSISSTAVMEAVAHGKHAAVLTDLGVKESLGNHFFIGSGLLTTLPELIEGTVPSANPEWLQDNGLAESDGLQAVARRVHDLLAHQHASSSPLPFPEMYYSPERAPYHADPRVAELQSQLAGPPPTAAQLRIRKLRKLVFSPRRFVADAVHKRRGAQTCSTANTR